MNRSVFVDFIQKVFPTDPEKAKTIAEFFVPCTIPKSQIFQRDGEVCNQYYFIVSGFARSYTIDIDGNEVTTGFYSEQEVVCDLASFFKRMPSRETFVAHTDLHCLVIDFPSLQKAFHALPEFREFGRTMLVNAYAGLKQRMLSTLHHTAEERYVSLITTKPGVMLHAPLKTIASFLGITDTSLSRIRKEFAKK